MRYNELSYKSVIAEEERMTALKNAMIGTILASAGKMMWIVSVRYFELFSVKNECCHEKICLFAYTKTKAQISAFVFAPSTFKNR